MSFKYTFSITNHTLNGILDSEALISEIHDCNIPEALDYINTDGDILDIHFKMELPVEEQTTLSGIVAAHTGDPLIPNLFSIRRTNTV